MFSGLKISIDPGNPVGILDLSRNLIYRIRLFSFCYQDLVVFFNYCSVFAQSVSTILPDLVTANTRTKTLNLILGWSICKIETEVKKSVQFK